MEKTGIVAVPGSGFGQADGSYHARITILPPDATFDRMLEKLATFQNELYAEWGEPGPATAT